MNRPTIRSLVMIASGAGIALAAASPAAAQDLRQERDGWSVHFRGPCYVYYDRTGRRIQSNPACRSFELRQADQLVMSRAVLPPRYRNRVGNSGYGRYDPVVRAYRNGSGYVDFRNGCVVRYGAYGRRISDTRPCNSSMRREADRLFGNRGYGDRYRPEGVGGYARPYVDYYRGMVRVQFRGIDCTYLYNNSGQHLSTNGRACNGDLRGIANEEYRRFREGRRW